jgi:hypothetical protein
MQGDVLNAVNLFFCEPLISQSSYFDLAERCEDLANQGTRSFCFRETESHSQA